MKGEGDAHVPPDTMFVSIQVETRCDGEDECFKLVSARADEVAAALRAKLGPRAEITKSSIELVPVYGTPSPTPTHTDSATGWKFTENVRATADSIQAIGALVDAGMAAGASSVVGSGFDFQGPPPGYAFGGAASPGQTGTRPTKTSHPQKPFVTLSIEAEGKTADECVKRGSEVAQRVSRVLTDKLGSRGTVAMDQYQVEKNEPHRYVYLPAPAQIQQGFSAGTRLDVQTRQLDQLTEIVEAAAAAGATNIYQVLYSLSDQSEARREAIARACADAQQKAETAARSLGVKLGKISRINVETLAQGDNRSGFALTSSAASRAEFVRQSVPHNPANVHADVSVTYLLE